MAKDTQERRISDESIINVNALIEEYNTLTDPSNQETYGEIERRIYSSLPDSTIHIDDLILIIRDVVKPYRDTLDKLTKGNEELNKLIARNQDDVNEKHKILEYYVLGRMVNIDKALMEEKAKNKKYRIATLTIVTIYAIFLLFLFY